MSSTITGNRSKTFEMNPFPQRLLWQEILVNLLILVDSIMLLIALKKLRH